MSDYCVICVDGHRTFRRLRYIVKDFSLRCEKCGKAARPFLLGDPE